MHIIEKSARNIYGEIDIIAADKRQQTIVFVEVKTRVSHDRGHPADAVTPEKQRRITRIALAYLRHHQLLESCSIRFDVMAITWPPDHPRPTIEHYEAAFDSNEKFQLHA